EELARARAQGDLASLGNTLAMPAALGVAAPWSETDLKKFWAEVWSAGNNKARKDRWARLEDWALGKGEAADRKLNRRLLPLQAQASACLPKPLPRPAVTLDDLDKARALLRYVEAPGNPRPAEVHFLVMLQRDVNREPAPAPDILRLALEVRVLAEEAALATS